MKRVLTLAGTLMLLISFNASASFVGTYDVSNWTTTSTGTPPAGGPPAGVDTSGAPNAVTLNGGDSGCTTFTVTDCTVQFTITAQTNQIQFHWAYTTADAFGASGDPFGYLVNAAFFQLTADFGPDTQSGDVTVALAPSDTFGFFVDCLDCTLGSSSTTISQFAAAGATATAPEPASLLLFAVALAALHGARKRLTRRSDRSIA